MQELEPDGLQTRRRKTAYAVRDLIPRGPVLAKLAKLNQL